MRRRPRGGFTLLEMLIVIAIIAVLAGITIPAVSAVRRRSQVNETKARMSRIGLALENYSNDFGDFPPSSLAELGVRGNGVNDGVEAMLRCLTTEAMNGPYLELKDEELVNTDADQLPAGRNPTRSIYTAPHLHEVGDSWGNPIVYLHNKDYDEPAAASLMTGEVKVEAGKSEKTGQYQALTTFQLWSAGPDGQAGTEDDVVSWSD